MTPIFAQMKIVTTLWRTLVSILTSATTVLLKIATPLSTAIMVDADMHWEILDFGKVNFCFDC